VPGFLQALDENTLRIYAAPIPYDPLGENLNTGNEIGVLVIELSTRRRMKVKGKLGWQHGGGFLVHAERVYALCPKYIQAREEIGRVDRSDKRHDKYLTTELSVNQQDWVGRADTFFIASFHPETGADASHRGRHPGFVRIVNARKIVFPDYSGNNMFNTLGNITANPNAGLLFIDFENGSTLQVTGRASVIWDQDRIEEFAGAERLVEFEIEQVIKIANAVPLRWEFLGYSPFNPGKRKD